MLGYIAQGLGYGFAAAVQPGPFQTYVLSQALNRGWRRALPMALAPLLSDAPIITLMLLVACGGGTPAEPAREDVRDGDRLVHTGCTRRMSPAFPSGRML